MKERFVPERYYRELHYKLMTLKQGNKSIEDARNGIIHLEIELGGRQRCFNC